MPLYFIVFLAMLAASMLLEVAAVMTVTITRRPLPSLVRGMALRQQIAVRVHALSSSMDADT